MIALSAVKSLSKILRARCYEPCFPVNTVLFSVLLLLQDALNALVCFTGDLQTTSLDNVPFHPTNTSKYHFITLVTATTIFCLNMSVITIYK